MDKKGAGIQGLHRTLKEACRGVEHQSWARIQMGKALGYGDSDNKSKRMHMIEPALGIPRSVATSQTHGIKELFIRHETG
jgi:hypothetical protein